MKSEIKTATLKTLGELVELPKGTRKVRVDVALLTQIDFSRLNRTLLFTISDRPKVEVTVAKEKTRLCCKVSISSTNADWPPYEKENSVIIYGYPLVYAEAIFLAALRVFGRIHESPIGWPEVSETKGRATLSYYLPIDNAGGSLAETLRSEWQKVRDELPSVLGLVGEGPQPDKAVPSEDPEVEDAASK